MHDWILWANYMIFRIFVIIDIKILSFLLKKCVLFKTWHHLIKEIFLKNYRILKEFIVHHIKKKNKFKEGNSFDNPEC